MKNNSVTWIAEFEMDLSFNSNKKGDNLNIITLKKYAPPADNEVTDNGNWMSHWLYSHIMNGEVLAYKTANLETPYTVDELTGNFVSVDTLITFDPKTFKETMVIVSNDIGPDDFESFRTVQLIYFDKSKNSFFTKLVAISPLLQITDENGLPIKKVPFAWVKMEDVYGQKINEKNGAIAWGATIETKATPLDFSQLKVLKGGLDLRQHIYPDALNGTKKVESTGQGFGKGSLLAKRDIEPMYNSIDTIITFDPQTYEETVEVNFNDFDPAGINTARLVQDWYYLPEKRLIINRLRAIAPLANVKDGNGNFMYSKPLYYIHY
ncbi:MAG TPA: hypothetical protein ENJ95_09945 [Bacteroidetes bacterium]|nr:hypothetical protein [Bacteroidota bacterium]